MGICSASKGAADRLAALTTNADCWNFGGDGTSSSAVLLDVACGLLKVEGAFGNAGVAEAKVVGGSLEWSLQSSIPVEGMMLKRGADNEITSTRHTPREFSTSTVKRGGVLNFASFKE